MVLEQSMSFRWAVGLLLLATVGFAVESPKDFGTYNAKEILKSNLWINGKPTSLKSLRGKVVVVDFWAFDCEPCIQAMPHIVDLYDRYSKDGLVVIGIHTPRADYERDVTKLRQAIERMGIRFPVEVDDKQKLFQDYLCDLWPSQFVIDRTGVVRYSHGGVGRYEDMEKVVRDLLEAR